MSTGCVQATSDYPKKKSSSVFGGMLSMADDAMMSMADMKNRRKTTEAQKIKAVKAQIALLPKASFITLQHIFKVRSVTDSQTLSVPESMFEFVLLLLCSCLSQPVCCVTFISTLLLHARAVSLQAICREAIRIDAFS